MNIIDKDAKEFTSKAKEKVLARAKENKTLGVIYVLTNNSFPDYVKIGYEDDINQRLKTLNRSECIPFPFHVYGTYETEKRLSDIDLQNMIDNTNHKLRAEEIDPQTGKMRRREFFKTSVEDAFDILRTIAKISGTTDRLSYKDEFEQTDTRRNDQADEMAEKKTTRVSKERCSFVKCGIKPASLITFIYDDSVVATVESEYEIRYKGKIYTTSKLAEEILNKKSLRGPQFWKYNGEILDDIRTRLEGEGLYK